MHPLWRDGGKEMDVVTAIMAQNISDGKIYDGKYCTLQ